jgi:hypothetical protein
MLALLASGSWLLASHPIPQETLKVDVNLVNVFVTVTDPAGNFITGLDRDDFRIFVFSRTTALRTFRSSRKMKILIRPLVFS